MLLGAKDRARSSYPDPTNEVCCWELEMLHRINTYQRARSTQSSLAMNSNGSPLSFRNSQKLRNDGIIRRRTINKEQISVVDPIARKLESIVLGLIQSDHVGDTEVLEDLNVVFGAISSLGLAWWRICRPHKRNEFIRQDPIKVTIFNFLIVFVLFVIKVSELIPSKANSELKSLQAMENSALIGAGISIASVSEGPKLGMVRCERFPDHLSCLLKHNDHECTHEVGCIAILIRFGRGIME